MAKIFLDTTYILPIFGIKIRLKRYKKYFPVILSSHEVYYSPVSLIEAKWIILKLMKKYGEELRKQLLYEYRRGIATILHDERFNQTVLTNSLIEEIAGTLLIHGVKDYFDRMIYATAYYYDSILLTEDEQLHSLKPIWLNGLRISVETVKWDILVDKYIPD